jgi:hypothetical protein
MLLFRRWTAFGLEAMSFVPLITPFTDGSKSLGPDSDVVVPLGALGERDTQAATSPKPARYWIRDHANWVRYRKPSCRRAAS